VQEFEDWFAGHEVEELIGVLLERAKDASHVDLEKLWERLTGADAGHRREINSAVARLVNRILHEPVEVLKCEARNCSAADFTRIVRTVCQLDIQEPTEES